METFLQIAIRYVTHIILNKHKLEKNTHQSHLTKPPITTIEINIVTTIHLLTIGIKPLPTPLSMQTWIGCSERTLHVTVKAKTPIHDNIRELVTWECKEHGANS